MNLITNYPRVMKGCLGFFVVFVLIPLFASVIVMWHDSCVKVREAAVRSACKQLPPSIRSNIVAEAIQLIALNTNQNSDSICDKLRDQETLCPTIYSLGGGNFSVNTSFPSGTCVNVIIPAKTGWVNRTRVLLVVQPDGVLPNEYNYDLKFERTTIGVVVLDD